MSENYYEEESFSTKFNGKTFKRILSLLKPYPVWVILFLVCVVISCAMESSQFYLTKILVDDVVLKGNFAAFWQLLKLYGSVFILQAIAGFGFIYTAGVLGEKIIYVLRKKMFDHLQTLSLSYFSVTPVGWIMSRVNSDTYRIADIITWGIIDSAYSILSIVISLIFMFSINVQMSLLVICILPLMGWAAWQFRRRILGQYRIVRKFNSKITGAFNEGVSGVRVVKSFSHEDENLKEFNDLTTPMYNAGYKAAVLNALFMPCIQVISSIALAGIIWYSGIKLSTGILTIGGVQAFINYVFSMLWPVQDLTRVYAEMQQSVASAERAFSLLDAQPAITDHAQTLPLKNISGNIEFDNVSFYYDDGDGRNVLTDFDLTVRHGETIALVGATGGGKSTIVNLLCRFYEPKKGVIRINGTDYTNFSQHDLQSHIGIVLQTPHLFSGTIRENILYGRLNASEEEIHIAAVSAGAYAFIKELPNGYDEQVGEGGNHLSVGQKQLISLARAILTDPDLFIMDEATSSVDTMTESLIQRGMENIMTDRTSIIIAHRLSTIRNADRILVIEDGKIAESGTHQELLRLQGKYYGLYTHQFRKEKEKAYRQEE